MKLKCPIIIFIFIGVQLLCQVLSGAEAEIPLALSQAIHLAQKANIAFLARQLDIDLSKCDPVTAGLRPNPDVQLQYGALTNGHDRAQGTTLFSGENTQYALQFGLTWQLSAKRRLTIKFAAQQSEIARQNVSQAGNELALEVGNKWLEVWYLKVMTDQANELRRLGLLTGAGIGVTIDMNDPIDAISDQLDRDPKIASETWAFPGRFLPNGSVWLRQSINASRLNVPTEFHN